MKFEFKPSPTHLALPVINIAASWPKSTHDAKYRNLPIVKWLAENVGEMAEFRHGSRILSGNGWEMGYDYSNPENFSADYWLNNHVITIRKDVDEKLLTEFVLRFS